ncbi:MAG: hypothetical protein QOC64_1073 [Solirubrobacteraceae bacterium]|jgi:hypothetical protein|nr:hypothetical protein [Solirubrobacteraceae bacterium]
MTLTPRVQRVAATFAVVSGAGLFGLALGGVAAVDGDLRAATVPPAPETRQVVERVGLIERDGAGGAGPTERAGIAGPDGCERPGDRRAPVQEL